MSAFLILASTEGCYGVGFLGVHDGRGADFVFIDWWAEENELHHHLYMASHNQPVSYPNKDLTDYYIIYPNYSKRLRE